MRLSEVTKQEDFILFKQRNNSCEGLTKGFWLGVGNKEEVTKFVYIDFLALNTLSLVIRMPFTL